MEDQPTTTVLAYRGQTPRPQLRKKALRWLIIAAILYVFAGIGIPGVECTLSFDRKSPVQSASFQWEWNLIDATWRVDPVGVSIRLGVHLFAAVTHVVAAWGIVRADRRVARAGLVAGGAVSLLTLLLCLVAGSFFVYWAFWAAPADYLGITLSGFFRSAVAMGASLRGLLLGWRVRNEL